MFNAEELGKLKNYVVEIILIMLALMATGISLFIYVQDEESSVTEVLATTIVSPTPSQKDIYVEVSGAVLQPDVYKVKEGARLYEVLKLAGGLSDVADHEFVGRNYNLAKYIGDQEKIYIPYLWDIYNGTFIEEKRILEYLQPVSVDPKTAAYEKNHVTSSISINTASLEQLDTLPGIGPSTAQKIIDGRPYNSVDDLVSKKIVKTSVFEEIQKLISL